MSHWNLHQLLIEYKLVQLPWKTFFQSLPKLKTCLPNGLPIPLLSKCPTKWALFSSENTSSRPFLSAGFTSVDSTKLRSKYLKKTSQKVPKSKTWMHWALWNLLGWSDVSVYPAVLYMQIPVICKYQLYANTVPFHIRDLSISWTHSPADTVDDCAGMFTVALCVMAKRYKQHKHPSTIQCIICGYMFT